MLYIENKQRMIFSCVWVVLLGGLPGYCMAQHGPAQVQVMPVEQREIAPTVRLVGTVRPQVRTVVAAEVAGLVSAMPADEGDRVERGAVLCKLRDLPNRLALDEAEATSRRLAAAVEERRAELGLAEFEKNRISGLWSNDRCTEKELRAAESEYEASKGRLTQAEQALAAQQAMTESLADDLARTEIVAPCDGYVVERRTEIGSWVDLGGPVAELVDLSTVRVRVSVPEAMIPFCSLGEEAIVTVEALKKIFPGTIKRVIPDADPQARTFPVEIDIPNPQCELKAGMFVRAAMPSGPKAMRMLVPKDAVVVLGPASLVYVVRQTGDGHMGMPLPAKVVSEVRDYVAVEAMGLAAGDLVIVRGNEFMGGQPGPVIPMPMGGAPQQGDPTGGPGAAPSQPGQAASPADSSAAASDSSTDKEHAAAPSSSSAQ